MCYNGRCRIVVEQGTLMSVIDHIPLLAHFYLRRKYNQLNKAEQRRLLRYTRRLAADDARRHDTRPLHVKGATGPLVQ